MSIIIVLSDTHGNHRFLRKALQLFPHSDSIFHLGDNYEDLDDHIDLIHKKTVIKVPGINHPHYFHPGFQTIQTVAVQNWKIALAHTKSDFKKKRIQADLYLYGHTHHAMFHEEASRYYLNPGHLKKEIDRGDEPSFAVLEIEKNQMEIKIYSLTGNLFFEKSLQK